MWGFLKCSLLVCIGEKEKKGLLGEIALSEKQLECRNAFELRMDLFLIPRQSASVFFNKREEANCHKVSCSCGAFIKKQENRNSHK